MWNCKYTLEGQAEALHADILNGTAVVVGNSSFQLDNGATAGLLRDQWPTIGLKVLAKPQGVKLIKAHIKVSFFDCGVILYSLKWFMDDYLLKQGQVLVVCNGISRMLWKAKANALMEPHEKHYDLISAIRNL